MPIPTKLLLTRIEAYVKYNRFHIEQRMHYEPDPFSQQALYYNTKEDYYVCPMGQHMARIGRHARRREADTWQSLQDTGHDVVKDVRCGAGASRARATGQSRSTTGLFTTGGRLPKDPPQGRVSSTGGEGA